MNSFTILHHTKAACYLGSASVLALMLAPSAQAAEWEISVGGYMEQYIGYSSYDSDTASDFDGLDSVGSGEFDLLPSITLDNGIKIGASVEIEGHVGESRGEATIDEAFVFVSGSFGSLVVGKDDTPGNRLHYGAPSGVGPSVNLSGPASGVLPSFIQFSDQHNSVLVGDDLYRGTLGSTQVTNIGDETQGRVTYFTPRFAGFQLGVSYSHAEAGGGDLGIGGREKSFDIGANYINTVGAVDVMLSGKYGTADNALIANDNPEYYGAGVNLGFGGITVGGSWAESNGSANDITDGRAYEAGIGYETGPYAFSFTYLNGENTDDEHAGFGPKERFEAFTVGFNYNLAGGNGASAFRNDPQASYATKYELKKGVRADVFGFASYVTFDEDVGDGGFGTPGDDVDGYVIGTGIRLTF